MPQNLNRKVFGVIRRPNGTRWAQATVKFTLTASTFTPTADYPAATVEVLTNQQGDFETYLWCNAEGLLPAEYFCTLPDATGYRFNLVYGDGTPIRDTVLRSAGLVPFVPTDPAYATMQTLIADAVAEVKDDVDEEIAALSEGGTLVTGYIAILTNGETADATAENQLVQLPDVPCKKAVIALPKAGRLDEAFRPDGRASANGSGRALYFGDSNGQQFYLEEGQAEELAVANLNQIWLRDTQLNYIGFNGHGNYDLGQVLTAYWRVIQ